MDNEPLRSAGKSELTIWEFFTLLRQLKEGAEPPSPLDLVRAESTLDWIVVGMMSDNNHESEAIQYMYPMVRKACAKFKNLHDNMCEYEISSLTNQAMTKICFSIKGGKRFGGLLHFRRWCFRVVATTCIDQHDIDIQRLRRENILEEEPYRIAVDRAAEKEWESAAGGRGSAVRGVPAELLAELLAELPEELRLREGDIEIYWKSAEDRDLAEWFHTTQGAVRVSRPRIRAKLVRIRAWLEKNRPEMYKKFRTVLGLDD